MQTIWNMLRSPVGVALAVFAVLALTVVCAGLDQALLLGSLVLPALGVAFTGTPASGTEYAAVAAGRKASVPTQVEYIPFSYTHALGAGTGEVNLAYLPPGLIRVLPDLSRIVTTQFAVNADLHLGLRAYTNFQGTTVAEDDNAFGDNLDAGGGALDAAFTLPTAAWAEINSSHGVVFFAMIDTGNIEDADTIDGYLAIMRVG